MIKNRSHYTIHTFMICLVTVFSPYFMFLKAIFYFWDQKTCLATQNRQKTVLKTQFVKEIENMQKAVFSS